jgi:hypothetical protein
MKELRDHPNVNCRAEPDDEYDRPEPLDPYLFDEDDDIDDEDELDEDEP